MHTSWSESKLWTLKQYLNSSLSQLLHRVFHPFLYVLWPRCRQPCWWPQLWLPAGLFWSQRELTLHNIGAAVSFHNIHLHSLLLLKAFCINPIKISITQVWNNLLKPCTCKQKHNFIFSWATYIEEEERQLLYCICKVPQDRINQRTAVREVVIQPGSSSCLLGGQCG